MFVSAFGYAAFIACFLKPMVGTILAASALLGLCAAVLWTAQVGNYVEVFSHHPDSLLLLVDGFVCGAALCVCVFLVLECGSSMMLFSALKLIK